MVQRIKNLFLLLASIVLPRRMYWSLRAADIDRAWGRGQLDYPLLEHIIDVTQPSSILDIGCGTGRLFPLFIQKNIPSILGQDVSDWALAQAQARYPHPAITLTNKSLEKLEFADKSFDLCISSRVLAAIPPKRIFPVVKRLTQLCKYIYLNELMDPEEGLPSRHWFRHDYLSLLQHSCKYKIIERGLVEGHAYCLIQIL